MSELKQTDNFIKSLKILDETPSPQKGSVNFDLYSSTKKEIDKSEAKKFVKMCEELKITNLADQKKEQAYKENKELFGQGIETWLNETLVKGENMGIEGILLKPTHKKPLSRYGIDKFALIEANLSGEDCQRIYQALFVYSVGFYKMLEQTLQKSPNMKKL